MLLSCECLKWLFSHIKNYFENPEVATAWASWFLVAVTAWYLSRQIRTSKTDLAVKLQMEFETNFYDELKESRKETAQKIIDNALSYKEIDDDIMNLFETVGLLLKKGTLDKHLVWSGFCFYCIGWWYHLEPYVLQERIAKKDKTLYEEFEWLNKEMIRYDMKKQNKKRNEIEFNEIMAKEFINEEVL